jgi:hypothetical protein
MRGADIRSHFFPVPPLKAPEENNQQFAWAYTTQHATSAENMKAMGKTKRFVSGGDVFCRIINLGDKPMDFMFSRSFISYGITSMSTLTRTTTYIYFTETERRTLCIFEAVLEAAPHPLFFQR